MNSFSAPGNERDEREESEREREKEISSLIHCRCKVLVYLICRRLRARLAVHYRAERNRRILNSSKKERTNGSDCTTSTSNINFAGYTQYLHLITAVCSNAISFPPLFSCATFPFPHLSLLRPLRLHPFLSLPGRFAACIRLLLLEGDLISLVT